MIKNISPREVWTHFAALNAVPRPSKKEERICAFMIQFGKALQLETLVDQIGNIIIKKPSQGSGSKEPIIMQAHLDMVHQKNNDVAFDFNTQGIEMFEENGWVKAKGTTLGADNGMGVAMIMAVLASKTLSHPPIEALFTVDEETGMTGALKLEPKYLSGKILLNLDTEEDNELSIGCAGGIDVSARASYAREIFEEKYQTFKIELKGLSGGHSGMDIHKGLANANKLMSALLLNLTVNTNLKLHSFSGGNLRNAIPREAFAMVGVPLPFIEAFKFEIENQNALFQKQFEKTDPNLELNFHEVDNKIDFMNFQAQKNTLKSLTALHNGVFAFHQQIPELVATSNNISRVSIENGNIEIDCLTRSFYEYGKEQMVQNLRSCFELAGMEVQTDGDYPGWEPDAENELVQFCKNKYLELFAETPMVQACHAGLECGILKEHLPNTQMVSFGPNIRGAHSPDEKVSIDSVAKIWTYVQKILTDI